MMFRVVFWVIRDEWQYAPLKRRSTIILHGSITQKTTLNSKLVVFQQQKLHVTMETC
jgi:hypothetical protein